MVDSSMATPPTNSGPTIEQICMGSLLRVRMEALSAGDNTDLVQIFAFRPLRSWKNY